MVVVFDESTHLRVEVIESLPGGNFKLRPGSGPGGSHFNNMFLTASINA
jgi:hypothetical protein